MFDLFGLDYFVDGSKRIFWLYLVSALMIALLFFWKQRAILKMQFSKEVLWHPSARLDYLYFGVMGIVKTLLLLPLLVGVNEVALWMVMVIQEVFGYVERIRVDRIWLITGYTTMLFVFNDLTRYWLHRWMHTSSLLWRFHRVHHSAEVLNPMTFYRVHPIENLLFGFRYALTTGAITALFIYFFGAGIGVVEIFGANMIVFIFMLIGANLRHSHIPLRYPKRIEKWLISPYQHQLHHTTRYSRYNYGSTLAVWDLWFGSLLYSKDLTYIDEPLRFGLLDEQPTHSLVGAFFNPFYKGIKL